MYIETEGIVIKSMKYGEADALLTLVTKKLGKVKVFSKGAKRIKNPNMSSAQIFALSNFALYPAKDAYSLQSSELIDNFFKISSDFDKFAYCSYLVEMADKLLMDNQPNPSYFNLLREMMDLVRTRTNYPLIKLVYDLKVFQYMGLKPEVLKCANCGIIEVEKYRYFSPEEGGAVCDSCRKKLPTSLKIDPSSIRFMNYVYEHELGESTTAKVSQVLIDELEKILDHYKEYHLGNLHLKSLELLNNFKEVGR